ncbi:MAG: hypothetical protein IJ772_04585 [Bacilli bacterium]|nr:hypothetical protein [Bacilli bacterium]
MADVTERSLSNLKLFFARVGGKDLPISANWNNPFGYNYTEDADGKLTAGEPIYKHSMNDVLANFETPVSVVHPNMMEDEKTVSDYLVAESSDNANAQMINFNSEFWNTVTLLLELININEAEWRNSPEGSAVSGAAYSCRGDEILRTNDLYTKGKYNAISNIYVPGSLNVTISSASTLSNRILRAEFSVTHATASDDTANEASTIRIDCFYSPDLYISVGATKNYAVYTYEDLDDSYNEIDDSDANKNYTVADGSKTTEFDAAITYKLHSLLNSGKYKSYRRYSESGTEGRTFARIGGTLEDEVVNGVLTGKKILVGATETTQVFYIFTSLTKDEAISDETLLQYIREYINSKYPSDADKVERNLRYPNLFSDTVIEIYPAINNKVKDGSGYKNPIDGKTLTEFFNGIGKVLTYGTAGFEPWEMFYVGAMNGLWSQGMRIPLVAFESIESTVENNPITSRYPKYRPIDNIADHPDLSAYTETIRFHQLCGAALSFLFGGHNGDSAYFIAHYKDTLTIDGIEGAEPLITDDLNWDYDIARTDENTNTKTPAYVRFTFKSVTYKFIDPTGMIA